jgi:hypothetical protein
MAWKSDDVLDMDRSANSDELLIPDPVVVVIIFVISDG